mgnify:FL=1
MFNENHVQSNLASASQQQQQQAQDDSSDLAMLESMAPNLAAKTKHTHDLTSHDIFEPISSEILDGDQVAAAAHDDDDGSLVIDDRQVLLYTIELDDGNNSTTAPSPSPASSQDQSNDVYNDVISNSVSVSSDQPTTFEIASAEFALASNALLLLGVLGNSCASLLREPHGTT